MHTALDFAATRVRRTCAVALSTPPTWITPCPARGPGQAAAVWADLDGDQIVFMTAADTVQGQAIARDPRVGDAHRRPAHGR